MNTNFKIGGLAVVLVAGLALAGCGGGSAEQAASEGRREASPQVPMDTTAPAEPTAAVTLAERENEIAERERQLAEREAALAKAATPKPAPRPAPVSAPKPAPAQPVIAEVPRPSTPAPAMPAVQRVSLSVPATTDFDVEFLDSLSSETSQVGDRFRARLTHNIRSGDRVAIPAGSMISGTVTEALAGKKIGGQSKLALQFDRVELPSGESTTLYANLTETGKSQTKKDAATIGGATAGGAILGRILDKKHGSKGTVLGGIVGAAVGSAIASKNTGDPVVIEIGTVVALNLEQPIHVVVEDGETHFDEYAMR